MRRSADSALLAARLATLLAVSLLGCSASDKNPSQCTVTGAVAGPADASLLRPFQSPSDPGPNGIWITASGEVLALGGYPFPPATADDVAFVDGWDVRFERLLVTIDHVTLSENPDRVPGDQSQTGPEVARIEGPWAIDLHQGGPLLGKGGSGEQAMPIAALTGQNENGCEPFDPTQRYAFGFDVVRASSHAINVNLNDAALADYSDMIARGYSVLYVGTARFRGESCSPANAEFDKYPLNSQSTVNFRLGFRSPTSYINCQNPDNQSAGPFEGEEYQRGLYVRGNQTAIAQVTLHSDHPFWDTTMHDASAHFDPFAARYTGQTSTPTAIVEDFVGVDYTDFADAQGEPLPWRNCVGSAFTPPDAQTMHFANTAGLKLRDFAEFMTFNQRTQGHFNSDGLCYVRPK